MDCRDGQPIYLYHQIWMTTNERAQAAKLRGQMEIEEVSDCSVSGSLGGGNHLLVASSFLGGHSAAIRPMGSLRAIKPWRTHSQTFIGRRDGLLLEHQQSLLLRPSPRLPSLLVSRPPAS
eukprot:scaffold257809_cov22-Prasinocladus_malaysianus.AAC.1